MKTVGNSYLIDNACVNHRLNIVDTITAFDMITAKVIRTCRVYFSMTNLLTTSHQL